MEKYGKISSFSRQLWLDLNLENIKAMCVTIAIEKRTLDTK